MRRKHRKNPRVFLGTGTGYGYWVLGTGYWVLGTRRGTLRHFFSARGHRQFGVENHAIASLTFSRVECGIAEFDQIALELCVGVEDGDPHADAEPFNHARRAREESRLLHRFAQALR